MSHRIPAERCDSPAARAAHLVAIASLALGCAPAPEAIDRTVTGTLTDEAAEHSDMHCDMHTFDAGDGWTVELTMESEFDNYIHLARGTTDLTEDDDASGGTNAKISYTTTASGPYIVYACALLGVGEANGDYQLHIVTRPSE